MARWLEHTSRERTRTLSNLQTGKSPHCLRKMLRHVWWCCGFFQWRSLCTGAVPNGLGDGMAGEGGRVTSCGGHSKSAQ